MLNTQIQVHIDQFDGPLALLLYLVQKEEMSIKDLNLTEITKQYLVYLQRMHELNFDIAGEFLYMAATLIYLKSEKSVNEDEKRKRFLEDGQSEIFSKEQLIEKLQELEKFQKLGQALWLLPRKNEKIFVRPKVNKRQLLNTILKPMDIQELTMAMIDILKREKKKFKMVKRDRLSIKEKLLTLKERLREGDQVEFTNLIKNWSDRDDLVITFISILELARLKKLSIYQNESWGEIYIKVVQSLSDFDVEMANGFENPEDLEKEKEQQQDQELAQAMAANAEHNEQGTYLQ